LENCNGEEDEGREGTLGDQEGRGEAIGQAGRKAQGREEAGAKVAGHGLPRPSGKPYGEAGKALEGVRILDFTHVQSGPTCTQLLAYMGADVIKVERPGVGDITRGQLRDVPNADSLYFTMLNGNKRSITSIPSIPRARKSSTG
jgi:Predicted acyl-CoA transferases/carnitine dehydratase